MVGRPRPKTLGAAKRWTTSRGETDWVDEVKRKECVRAGLGSALTCQRLQHLFAGYVGQDAHFFFCNDFAP